ncbi:MAG TPA: RES domain-containing protein [Chthoniobacterales bacterium]|nr:RES domain-containing protein [Chthoniobacterales bacterium]
MPSAWRIVNARYAKQVFTGEGARREGGRWNSVGVPVVYLSAHRSLALLEILARVSPAVAGDRYVFVEASWDNALMEPLPNRDLPAEWRAIPPTAATAAIGDGWIAEARSAVLAVPNVIIPAESNYLLNPAHPDFRRVKIGRPEPFLFDPRLLHA